MDNRTELVKFTDETRGNRPSFVPKSSSKIIHTTQIPIHPPPPQKQAQMPQRLNIPAAHRIFPQKERLANQNPRLSEPRTEKAAYVYPPIQSKQSSKDPEKAAHLSPRTHACKCAFPPSLRKEYSLARPSGAAPGVEHVRSFVRVALLPPFCQTIRSSCNAPRSRVFVNACLRHFSSLLLLSLPNHNLAHEPRGLPACPRTPCTMHPALKSRMKTSQLFLPNVLPPSVTLTVLVRLAGLKPLCLCLSSSPPPCWTPSPRAVSQPGPSSPFSASIFCLYKSVPACPRSCGERTGESSSSEEGSRIFGFGAPGVGEPKAVSRRGGAC